jgi:hypothetical protein
MLGAVLQREKLSTIAQKNTSKKSTNVRSSVTGGETSYHNTEKYL